MQTRRRLRTPMRSIPRPLQIPAFPIDGLSEPVHAVRHLHWKERRPSSFPRPQILVEDALGQLTRGWCRYNSSSRRTYIVVVGIGRGRLVQKIHHRLPVRWIEASGVVVLLVRRDAAVDSVRREEVDGFADGLRRLLAVVEARENVSRCFCLLGRSGEVGLHVCEFGQLGARAGAASPHHL